MSNTQDTLENRLEQVHGLVTTLIMVGEAENAHMTPQLMAGALWSVQELVEQAKDAFTEMCHDPERTGQALRALRGAS